MASLLASRDFLLSQRTDTAVAYRDFRWPTVETLNWALEWFDVVPTRTATALWIVDPGGTQTRLSFGDLTARSNRVANHLRGLGVRRGDRVLVMLGNVPELWETMLAAMKLGAVVIPASTLLPADEIRDRVDRGGVRAVVAQADLTSRLVGFDEQLVRVAVGAPADPRWVSFVDAADCPERFEPDAVTRASDPLLWYFTSGTTRQPKLVEHTHASYPVGHLSTMYWLGLQPGDVHLNISSPGWAKHAWSCLFAPWLAEAAVFVFNQPRFDASGLLDALTRYPVTSMCAPPTVWRMLIQHDLAAYRVSLRELVSAGEPLNPEVISQVEAAWRITVRDGYGQTETTAQVGNPPGQPAKPGAMGLPLPGYRIALLDADGGEADEGEICIDLRSRPTGLMTGYHDDPSRTGDVIRDGYYHTGDVASRDADGYLTYVGRTDDVFKASDYRISPFELESALIEHPAVAEAAVVPSPDPVRTAVPKAYVTLVAGYEPDAATAHEILAFCRERLAPFKRVRRIEFAALPKTISGKIRRVELRTNEQARGGATRHACEFWEDDFPDLRSGR
jgi:acetyl-CoA synthetase